MRNVITSRLRAHLFDGQKIGGDTSPADDREVLVELVRRLYDRSDPGTASGKFLDERLEALEEEIEAGLSSLGEQVDRHDTIIMELLRAPEKRGLARAQAEPVADGPMPLPELADGARRHLEKAEECLDKVVAVGSGMEARSNDTWIETAKVHIETAVAMANLLEALHG